MSRHLAEFSDTGRLWVRSAVSSHQLTLLDGLGLHSSSRLLALPKQLSIHVEDLAGKFIPGAKIVRLTSFNKSREQNWSLPWHQDRVIAVKQKIEVSGFKNWTRKKHYWHCEPPQRILDRMMFARLYLDDTFSASGDLELALGSHKLGTVLSNNILESVKQRKIETCEGRRGDMLFVKALTLHRSSQIESLGSRRILRIDFSAEQLPSQLEWAFT